MDLYTPARLRQRLQVRKDPEVVHCIRAFWQALYSQRSKDPHEVPKSENYNHESENDTRRNESRPSTAKKSRPSTAKKRVFNEGMLVTPRSSLSTLPSVDEEEMKMEVPRPYLPEHAYKSFHKVLQRAIIPSAELDEELAEMTAHTDW